MNKRTSRVLRLPFKLRVFELFDGRLNERPVVFRYFFVGHPSRPVITILANEADAWPAALPYGMHIDAEENGQRGYRNHDPSHRELHARLPGYCGLARGRRLGASVPRRQRASKRSPLHIHVAGRSARGNAGSLAT
jgi:hypothetical protein